jgi:hypothetical protein
MKLKAENTLRAIADNYSRLLSERLVHELEMAEEAEATGNAAAVQHHKVLADVYRSMLERWQAVKVT